MRKPAKKPAKRVYRFSVYCGRMGDLEGVFVADAAAVKSAIGQTAHFGEVLGKYSSVNVTLEREHFKTLTADPDFIAKFERFKLATGHNPLDYLTDDADDEELPT